MFFAISFNFYGANVNVIPHRAQTYRILLFVFPGVFITIRTLDQFNK